MSCDANIYLISKPFTFDHLAARVRDVLDRRSYLVRTMSS
jgi:DNA-binding response OmpR family regulator